MNSTINMLGKFFRGTCIHATEAVCVTCQHRWKCYQLWCCIMFLVPSHCCHTVVLWIQKFFWKSIPVFALVEENYLAIVKLNGNKYNENIRRLSILYSMICLLQTSHSLLPLFCWNILQQMKEYLFLFFLYSYVTMQPPSVLISLLRYKLPKFSVLFRWSFNIFWVSLSSINPSYTDNIYWDVKLNNIRAWAEPNIS